MSSQGLEAIDHAVQQAHVWINALDDRLGWRNKRRSYRLLKAVLHAVRDQLDIHESAQFAAQLPTLLRGVYYEQWRPSETPVRQRHRNPFLERIGEAFREDPLEDAAAAVGAVFGTVAEFVSPGELDDVAGALPLPIRSLWRELA